ncbi:glycosyltransferase family 2 protein [Sphingomonas sp. ID0503]|uniref:glycosyltransferase family 2 protein n=1 Tax=Sphingomonas sp. ID0503 TaxID=3399691 RepID=UPI003AFA069B
MRIAVIMMQRDESDLLHPWITYHSALLGPENLVIIDNGSIESAALARLDQARSEGVRVISAPTRADFKRKGPLVQNIGRALSETHDWIVPLDCDEFLGTFDKDRFVAGRDELERAFRSAARKGAVARVTHAFWNLPGQTGLYYNKIHKVAFKPQAPIKLDKGFHLFDGKSKSSLVPEGLETASRICYLHYHNRHAAELLKSARYKLEGQVPDFRRRTLIDFKGSGRHVARYFMSEPETYHRKLKPATWDAAAVFEDVGLVPPFPTRRPRSARRSFGACGIR